MPDLRRTEQRKPWGNFMMKQGVFAQEEIGFGYVTESPQEAVNLVVRSLPPAVRKCPKLTGS